MTQIKRSFIFSGIDRFGTVAITLATTALFARLLRPDEIGVYLLGASIVQIATGLREFGATAFIIQDKTLSREGLRTIFTVMLCLSVVLTTGLIAASNPIAAFYAEPRIEPVLKITSLGMLLACFGSAPVALMQRELAFASVATVNLAGALTNLLAACLLYGLGQGYLCLAWGSLASMVAMVLVTLLLRPEFWIFRPCTKEWRRVLCFATYSSATALLGNTISMLPQFIIGRAFGFVAVGVYSRASMLCQLPDRVVFSAFTPVLLPALSARIRAGGDIKQDYLRAIAFISAIQFPVLTCMILLADPLVLLFLGPQWGSAVPLVRIMSLASLVLFPVALTYPTLVAKGRIRDTFLISLFGLACSLPLMLLAARVSLVAVAATTCVTSPAQLGLTLWLIRRCVPFSWSEFFSVLGSGIGVTCFAALPPAAILTFHGTAMGELAGALAALGSAAGWLLGLKMLAHPLLSYMLGLAAFLLPMRKRAPAVVAASLPLNEIF